MRRLAKRTLAAVAAVLLAAAVAFAQGKGGPKHVFAGPAPKHPFDVILARPTNTSVTASVLAYQDSTAFISYGTEAGKLTEKTAEQKLNADTPVEFTLKNL